MREIKHDKNILMELVSVSLIIKIIRFDDMYNIAKIRFNKYINASVLLLTYFLKKKNY